MTDRQSSNQDLIAALDRALAATGRLIAGVEAQQWSNPTPCTEWDVRQVVDHLISGNLNFAALVGGEPQPTASSAQPAADPVAAYRSAASALRAAFAQPGALERTYQSPLGPAPGAMLVHLRITELLVHGWDLARATGQPAERELPADLAAQELAGWHAQFGDALPPGLPFGPAQPVAAAAPAIDRLAAFLGRAV